MGKVMKRIFDGTGQVILQSVIFNGTISIVALILFMCSVKATSELTFSGNLRDMPCQVDAMSQSQDITLPNASTAQMNKSPGSSAMKGFTISLVNCQNDIIGKVVKLTFRGLEEVSLPGYLAVNGANAGKIGIGIIDTDGSSILHLDDVHNQGGGVVSTNTIHLNFSAYAQSTPLAIANQNVVPGDYSALTTFEISYN